MKPQHSSLAILFFCCLFSLSLSGCAQHYHSGWIPWWKGIPASVLSPSSQEAFGWKKQRHGHQWEQEIYPSGGSYAPSEKTLQSREGRSATETIMAPPASPPQLDGQE